MELRLSEVTSEEEFDAIWPVDFKAFHNPHNTFSKFFNPIHTTLDEAINVSKERHIRMWKVNPACHWIKVMDVESRSVLGAACWGINIGEHAPKPNAEKKAFNAGWHIEGSEEKLFAEKLIGGLMEFIAERVARPHIVLNQMIVHPDYRRYGIGRMLIEWGVREADKHGVETVIESVPFAAPVYEKCGFGRLEQIGIDFSVENPSDTWKKYQSEDTRAFLMWRPVGHDYREGDVIPWKTT
ncbi:hypothetical protein CC80DRAFT_440970 [Byssothecium circinans]|uniref:N-acetyltransferase domain-containing protein n=1 Tax=Byssothecium circinans TaxID=147558 RepID=A0A6A5U565_9PLEO|nr:hypothetical protein CC80DRAFT_440970 [Byssothecium circinans]